MDACGVDAASIVGLVRVWGRVVLQGGMVRAERAEVVMLGAYLQWSSRQRVAAAHVAEQLGCRLVPLETLREQASEICSRQGRAFDQAIITALEAGAATSVQVPGPSSRVALTG